jgi:hypothetical protein
MEMSGDKLEALLAKYFRPRGTCQLCQKQDLKGAMAFHLGGCLAQHQHQADGRPSPKYLLLVEGRDHPEHYWLYLEMVQQAKLARLDQLLRKLWLECCGHLSAFTIENTRYSSDAGMYEEEWETESSLQEEPMDVPIRRVLSPGWGCTYEYDYGSTTFLSIQVVSAYTGVATGSSIQLLARNDLPHLLCNKCSRVATFVCPFCKDTAPFGKAGWFCQRCAKKHDCGFETMLPVVNSPRVGVCGYGGELST